MKASDITIENNNGQLTLSAVVNGQRLKQRYSGYTRKEARARFINYCKTA